MFEQMEQAKDNQPKRRNHMMESARLRADIVDGLGADEGNPERQADHEAEPTRKYAMMKTNN